MNTNGNGKPSMAERLRDREGIDRAIRRGVQEALRVHKLLGHPVIGGRRDGSVFVIPPEEIVLDEEFKDPPKLPDDMIP